MNIGIMVASSQSGRAYLADLVNQGHYVYGYCRYSEHGRQFVSAINKQDGIILKRPEDNQNKEASNVYIPLGSFRIGYSLEELIAHSELIIFAEPSVYFKESAEHLKKAGICKKKIPIILSPCRTLLVPQLWKILGEGYPIIGFSTCAYSCKSPENGVSFIKRRKRVWIASIEGNVTESDRQKLQMLFPQCIWSTIPAVTSLGNMGMVFHPATYLLNYENIIRAGKEKREYSFYMEGISDRPEVGGVLEEIDAARLKIAEHIGIKVLKPGNMNDEAEWHSILEELHIHERDFGQNILKLRNIRRKYLDKVAGMVVGAQFWLDYTYGVNRVSGEPLYKTIGRTPTYQKMSVAQKRYVDEDIPTGLLPLYLLGKFYRIDMDTIEGLLMKYCEIKKINFNNYINSYGAIAEDITDYLRGNY